jgi:hypothetical protein
MDIFFDKRALLNLFVRNNKRAFYSEQMLLEFSNRVGAFITFCILQTLNPSNKLIIPTTTKYPMARNQAAEQWLNNCINHMVIFLLIKYRNAISNITGGDSRSGKGQQRFLLGQNVMNKMLKSFDNIYPNIYKELTKEFAGVLTTKSS